MGKTSPVSKTESNRLHNMDLLLQDLPAFFLGGKGSLSPKYLIHFRKNVQP